MADGNIMGLIYCTYIHVQFGTPARLLISLNMALLNPSMESFKGHFWEWALLEIILFFNLPAGE